MNVAFSIVLLFILLDCVMNEKPPCAKGCHVPLTAFYRPVKALLKACKKKSLNVQNKFVSDKLACSQSTRGYLWDAVGITMPNS